MPSVAVRGPVLLVEPDPTLAGLIAEMLQDEGYEVVGGGAFPVRGLLATIGHVAPACVLLADATPYEYGAAWMVAAELAACVPPVPVVMFTTHPQDAAEAEARQSARSKAAAFAAILLKPFDYAALLAVMDTATRRTMSAERHAASGWSALAQVVLGRSCTGASLRSPEDWCCRTSVDGRRSDS